MSTETIAEIWVENGSDAEDAEGFARAILAARDAQWREMLGEPVGEVRDCVWRGMSWSVSIIAPTKLDLRTPLYAIKETP